MRILLVLFFLAGSLCRAADPVVVLPLFNPQQEKSPELDWVGESIAETLRESIAANQLLALSREDREEVYRRIGIRPGALLTRATVIKIGGMMDASLAIFGEFNIDGAEVGKATLKSRLEITLHILDLTKYSEGPPVVQSGLLQDLSQIETRTAYAVLKQLRPRLEITEAEFVASQPTVKTEAEESYIRGLLATTTEQKSKLFAQAARLDDHFSAPNFQMGRMLFQKKDYKAASTWLQRVSRNDSRFLETSYLLGICRYYSGDFEGAAADFKLVSGELPLNEVWNNLGAALSRQNKPAALESFEKALEGDTGDPDYWFNIGYWLWKNKKFNEAAEKFRAVLDRTPDDTEATTMLGRCIKMDIPRAGDPRTEGRERIKTAFEDSAFRRIAAELQGKRN